MYYYCDTWFLLILLGVVIGREVPDLTFVIKNTSSIEPICIADKNILYSAIAWSYPIEALKDELPTIVSKYIPEMENAYTCNFLQSKHCSDLWQMDDWQFSKFDSHNFKPTLDSRWEDFPTLLTSKNVTEFKNRIDIPHTFELGISIRAENNAEIFLCTGWDPYSYPCYYIHIGGSENQQAYLGKYKSIPKQMGKNDTKLDKYNGDDKILSSEEWSNYIVSLNQNGTVSLMETLKNITLLNYTDNINKVLHPINLFIRSGDTKALWKIHNNHYIFTNKTKLTQLGPSFSIYGDNLCVSLYVSMCRYCRMTFYILINNEKQIIKTVFNENDNDDLTWKEIRLVQHNVLEDTIKLFVETKYVNNTIVSDGFWAIDDVRVCSEDEIKVSRLIMDSSWKDSYLPRISCQALAVPTWRPIQYKYKTSKDEIECTPTTTTIKIASKPQTDDDPQILQHYVIQYEGQDLCNDSSGFVKSYSRVKSKGYLIAHSGQTIIKDLIPYTRYNITFWNVIDDIKISQEVNTQPIELTNLEQPKNVVLQVTNSTCEIMWDAPNCNETFGPIVYQVIVSINGSICSNQTDSKTRYTFKDLNSSASYNVEIKTSRKLQDFGKSNLSLSLLYNFTTYSNEYYLVAPTVKNLEVYATTKNVAQLRFDLSKSLQNKSNSVQVRWCHPLLYNACNSDVKELKECKLWHQKFCIEINNLTTGIFPYTFYVSLKNKDTHSDGGEANITAVIIDRVPGTVANVTYKIRNCAKTVDCCHLNISWVHPYNQSGSITTFDIVLTESSYTYVLDSFKRIHEVLTITNETYKPIYNYNVKYIPCNVPYKISVRAVNNYYKGQYVSTTIATRNTDYVDSMPKYINSTNETVVFQLPQTDVGSEGSSLIIVVQDYNKNKTRIDYEINEMEIFDDVNELCNQFGETWIAKAIELNDTTPLVVIGDGTSSFVSQYNKTVINKPLTPDTQYCFTFTVIKRFQKSEHVAIYHDKNLFTEPNYFAPFKQDVNTRETVSVATYLLPVLFIILLFTCGAWISYRYFKKRRYGTNDIHGYESMPFEDYLTDAVSSDTYDRLS